MTDRSIGYLRRLGEGKLSDAGIPSPSLDWDLICMAVMSVDRAWVHCHGDYEVSHEEMDAISLMVSRRASREPLHYVIGSCPFWGMDFSVAKGCLVPRPETEFLVEGALENFDGGFMVDWGTGSGCIAGAVLTEREEARGIAVDSSSRAIEIAYGNLKSLGLLERCLLWHCFDPWKIPVETGAVDLIISNPPYIASAVVGRLMPEVSLYEPSDALDGGRDGLDPYRALLPWASKALKSGGRLWVEFGGADQVDPLIAMAPMELKLEDVREDLSGIPRLMSWRRV